MKSDWFSNPGSVTNITMTFSERKALLLAIDALLDIKACDAIDGTLERIALARRLVGELH